MRFCGRIFKMVGAVSVLLICILAMTAWAEEVKVGAGAAPSENIFKKIKDPMAKDLGLKLVLIDSGPYEALIALDKKEVEAAHLRRLAGHDGKEGVPDSR
jgi:ABC-type metal ion transport system substrate-binding protein